MSKLRLLQIGTFALVLSTGSSTLVASPEKSTTAIDNISRGASVVLQGQVTRILDEDEFRLEDGTGSVQVYIGWRNRVPVEVGETVTVKGVVDDDLTSFFRPEVYANELIREDGTVLQLK